MLISVAICTWNRSRLLDQTLAQMRQLVIPAGVDWELLIVNNNASDDTDSVLAKHRPHVPIRRLFERRQGQTCARNCAMAAAKGEAILWTDDDVLVHPAWLSEYARSLRERPSASFFGGPVEAWFEGTPPEWLPRVWSRVANAYAVRQLGEEPFAFSPTRLPFGANFAVRTVQQRRYLYDPTLGRKAHSLLGDDETSLLRRMLADGLPGWWVPRARVRHFIPKERQTVRYLRKYFAGQGEIAARRDSGNGSARLLGRPRWLWRSLIEREASFRWHYLTRPVDVWIEDLIVSSTHWGLLRGYGRGAVS